MSTKLYLVRRWGPNQPGQTITVDDDEQARWLLGHNFAQRSKDSTSVTDGAAAPGTHGPDPRAGGDASRLRPMATPSSDKRDNRATPVAGSPVQFNAGVAPEDAPGSRKGDDQDSPEDDGSPEPSSKLSGSGRRRTKS